MGLIGLFSGQIKIIKLKYQKEERPKVSQTGSQHTTFIEAFGLVAP